MLRLTALGFLAAAALIAGCGGSPTAEPRAVEAATAAVAATATPTATPTRRLAPRGVTVGAVRSQFGTIVGDGRGSGRVTCSTGEESEESECYGDCARAWPPVLTKGRPVGGQGRSGSAVLGTTRRRERQAPRSPTTGGRCTSYVDDAPGRVLRCHNVLEFGGLWLVVRPNGQPVR